MSHLMNQAKNRWDRFAYLIKQSIPNHKHDHFNMIAQMSRRELKEFIVDNKYVYELIMLYKNIEYLIKNTSRRIDLQKKSINNFYLTHSFVSKIIDEYRSEKFNANTL